MRDDASLSDDARGRGSFHVTRASPPRVLSSRRMAYSCARGTSGDPADARRMLGDWAETPHFERATLRLFPPGTLDHATGVPRFGRVPKWVPTRGPSRAKVSRRRRARDETEPPAAAVANVEETDDHHEIEATREGTPGEPPSGTIGGTIVRGNHPTPPAASDHDITAALFEDPVAGGGTPTPAPSPAGVNHERGWWIRTRGDASHPTPPR